MPDLTHTQAQWLWLAVTLFITAFVITMDVVLIDRFGANASFSRSCGRVWARYWSVALALAFWLGAFFGHAHLPSE